MLRNLPPRACGRKQGFPDPAGNRLRQGGGV